MIILYRSSSSSNSGHISGENQTLSQMEFIRTSVLKGLETLKESRKELKKLSDPISQYPDVLKDAARLLRAMPPTQVSVERLFSALKIFKSDLRSCLKSDILNALLLLKANMI